MPFLRSLVREVARKAAQDPRIRETAKKMYEDEIRPRAKNAWDKAKPEVEAAWEKAKPEVEAARKKALSKAADLTDGLKRRIEKSAVAGTERPNSKPDGE